MSLRRLALCCNVIFQLHFLFCFVGKKTNDSYCRHTLPVRFCDLFCSCVIMTIEVLDDKIPAKCSFVTKRNFCGFLHTQSAWYLKQTLQQTTGFIYSPSPVLSPRKGGYPFKGAALAGAAAQYSRWPASRARDRALCRYRRRNGYSRAGTAPAFKGDFLACPQECFPAKMKILCGCPPISVLSFIGHNKKRICKIFFRKITQKILISGKTRSGTGVSFLHFLWVSKAYKSQKFIAISFFVWPLRRLYGLRTDAL